MSRASQDAPLRYITNAATGWATIWWEPPTPAFTREVSPAVPPAEWAYASTGANHPATVPTTLPTRFYHLQKP